MGTDGSVMVVAGSRMTSADLATWRLLLDTTTDLRGILGARLQADSGLSPGDYQVMLALSEADGGRLRSSQLAAAIDWERSRLSHHLLRMERRGLIVREDCAADSRGAEVVLTERGTEAFRGATRPHLRAIKSSFADALTPSQMAALTDVLLTLQTHLRQHSTDGGRQ
jgi:DNA-binding MarR family transcriptional regulator